MKEPSLSLFRSRAVTAQRPPAYGRVVLARPISFSVLTAAAVLTAGAIIGLSIWGTYSQRTTLRGQLVPNLGLTKVYAPQGGTIVERHVSDGDVVTQGDVLYVLSNERASSVLSFDEGPPLVTATGSGTAVAVAGDIGQLVDGSAPLLSIIPEDSELEAHLYAPSRVLGFIHAGDRVLLHYSAYNYQRFGSQEGTVQAVSPTPVATADVRGRTPTANDVGVEPLYRITVTLPSQTITAYGEERPLQVGMTLDAVVLQETQHLYQLVTEPLNARLGRSR